MKYEYFHQMTGDDRKTFVIEVPSKEKLQSMLNRFETDVILDFGHVDVHPKDQYNKKIGRKKAHDNIIHQTFQLMNVGCQNERQLFVFSDFTFTVVFSIAKDSPNSRLDLIFRR